MTGWKKTTSLILISITALSIPSILLLSTPSTARAASLSHRLTVTRQRLRHARAKLNADRLAYAAALAAAGGAPVNTTNAISAAAPSATSDPTATPAPAASATSDHSATPAASATPTPSATPAPVPTPDQLRRAVLADQRRVRVLRRQALRLRQAIALKAAAARGDWLPIVRDAAHRTHVSATGLRRLMSLESGGRAYAENGSFHGLYQYCWSTWRAAWNPWRHSSLYDGAAQIRATATAIHRGWGARMWPHTYPRAF